ncbi:MAG: flagellar hook-length control protein FliK [Polaromonas sp.]
MSLILPSATAPAPAANPGTNATTRYDEQDQNNSGSFGEALARSMEPAGEKTDKPAAKAATAQPARRQAGNQKNDAEDLANAMALSFVPIENRMPQAILPAGTGTAAESATPSTTLASMNNLLAGIPAQADGAANAPEVVSDADASALPLLTSPVPAAASPKSASQPPLHANLAAVSDGVAIQIDPRAIAGQSSAPGTAFSEQSSQHDDKNAHKLSVSSEAQADLAPATPYGASKVAASTTAATKETAGLNLAAGPVAADATASTSTALPMTPATAAVNVSGGVTAPNAPIPIATASLVPEVGSNEWGKALGQHVIQMGNAGHQVAELQLNPPGLGPLKVTLSMSDNQMQAMFVSAHSSVRAAVEAALPQLRTTLADSGISLGNTSVGAESQQQAEFSNNQNSQPERGAYRPGAGMGADTATLLPARSATEPVRRSNGLSIDTYA